MRSSGREHPRGPYPAPTATAVCHPSWSGGRCAARGAAALRGSRTGERAAGAKPGPSVTPTCRRREAPRPRPALRGAARPAHGPRAGVQNAACGERGKRVETEAPRAVPRAFYPLVPVPGHRCGGSAAATRAKSGRKSNSLAKFTS